MITKDNRNILESLLEKDQLTPLDLVTIEAIFKESDFVLAGMGHRSDKTQEERLRDEANLMLKMNDRNGCKQCGDSSRTLTFGLCQFCFEEDLKEQAKSRPQLLE